MTFTGNYTLNPMPHQLYPVSTYITNKLMGYVGKSLGAEITGMLQKRSIVFHDTVLLF